jgi:hypothetical protein
MNNGQQHIIDEAYENYCTTLIGSITFSERGKHFKSDGLEFNSGYPNYVHYSQEEYINKCKTDTEFSEKWGLKIEERELSLDERVEHYCSQNWVLEHLKDSLRKQTPEQKTSVLSVANIPTKLITITYQGKTIESYG